MRVTRQESLAATIAALLILSLHGEVRGVSDPSVELATQARSVLRHHCVRCHNGVGSEGGDFDVLDVNDLKESGLIVELDAHESLIYTKIANDRMPPRSIPARVSHRDGEVLRRWIEVGAPEFAQPTARPTVVQQDVLQAVQADLARQAREDRKFLRYLTLHQRHNNADVFDEELLVYRAGLAKAVNSLSNASQIVIPRSVAKPRLHDTLFAIDIRDYGWKLEQWDEILRRYPYGLSMSNHPDDQLRELATDIIELSESQIPILRADWFVAMATRPPLYHLLLDIPNTAESLERRLGVSIAEHFSEPTPQRIARAGFAKSGVSGQNRMVERNDSRDGMYWKSYDFLSNNGRSKLTRFPLGPLNLFARGAHPFSDQAFVHDGGEIIWRLPNGLHAYMLTDGEGNRIDEGPIAVVSDALKTSGTPSIVNGVSCFACHKHGMIPFVDSIRENSAVFGEAERLTKRLYVEQAQMDKLLEKDREQFMRALEETIGPVLADSHDNRDLEDFVEPIGEVARWHRLEYLNIRALASELDVQDPEELVRRIGSRRLKSLGLESLTSPDGVISRAEWEAFLNDRGPSLMQQVAKELRYVPIRPL